MSVLFRADPGDGSLVEVGIGLRALMLCALLSFLVVGVDGEDASATTNPGAARALTAITTADFDVQHPRASFPVEWEQRMGYWPAVVTGPEGKPILIKPDGDCSSFSGDTSYGFDTVCKEHDLSYDVLRYSADIGQPLPAQYRHAADAMFRRELHNQCTDSDVHGLSSALCHFWAESFAVAVDINSWRQGYRPPVVHEPMFRWELMILLFAALYAARCALVWLERDMFAIPRDALRTPIRPMAPPTARPQHASV